MVRTIIKGLLALLVVAGAAPFILPLDEGRPLLSLDDLKAPSLPELPKVDLTSPAGESAAEPGPAHVYRWKDEGGNWHYSDEAPPEGTAYETIVTEPVRNTIPAPAQPASEPEGTAAAGASEDDTDTPSIYSPEGVRKVLEDARDVQTLMDDHNKRLDGQL
jgi:hypothetical protein